jgi:2'-5' RNA ligase
MSAGWRCFVAVPLGDSLRSALSEAVPGWRLQPPADGLRWAEPDAWHLTLAFLGTVNPDDEPRMATAIGGVAAGHPPTEVATGRLGAFHRPGSARVLWYGVHDADGRLTALAGELACALGLDSEEAYRPHVTLARARRRPVDLRGWIEVAAASAPEGRLTVDRVSLMRSHLGGGPARYETLETFTLGGAP